MTHGPKTIGLDGPSDTVSGDHVQPAVVECRLTGVPLISYGGGRLTQIRCERSVYFLQHSSTPISANKLNAQI